jgi:hypothetical protein
MLFVNFPSKLYGILESESTEIIIWHARGHAFKIIDLKRFEEEIAPKYFRREIKLISYKYK